MARVIRSYRDLLVWQRAMELDQAVTQLVRKMSRADRFVYESQVRRASVSIAANVSEGHERNHTAEFLQHVYMARGSLAEVETNLLSIRRNESSIEQDIATCLNLADEVGRMLSALAAALRLKVRTLPRSRARV